MDRSSFTPVTPNLEALESAEGNIGVRLKPHGSRCTSRGSESVCCSTSSRWSIKQQEARIKLQVAQFALKQKQDEQREAEKRLNYEAELKSKKAQIEAEEACMKALLDTKEAQRGVEIAQYKTRL